jgi:protein CpxP
MLGRALDLTPEQKAKIAAIMEAEQPTIRTLRTALREGRQALGEAVRSGAFDEDAVRTIATKQAATLTELMVVGARVESKIYTLLTPEQRTLAERLRPLLNHRLGPHRPF